MLCRLCRLDAWSCVLLDFASRCSLGLFPVTHVAHVLHVCLLSVLHGINFAIIAMCLQKFAVT